MINDINDKISKKCIFTPEEIIAIKSSAEKEYCYFEEEIRAYFNEISNFDTFKNKYPDLFDDLYIIYDKNVEKNNHFINRSNYIKKNIELSNRDFQKLIFKRPSNIMINAINNIFRGIDEYYSKKILEKLQAEGLIDESFEKENIGEKLLSSALSDKLSNISYTALGGIVKGISFGLSNLEFNPKGDCVSGMIKPLSEILITWRKKVKQMKILRRFC